MTFDKNLQFPSRHRTITPSDANKLVQEMIIRCGGAGDIRIEDKDGVAITYTVTAGEIVPVLACKVLATGTTVTKITGHY